jgi:hypothetical protein
MTRDMILLGLYAFPIWMYFKFEDFKHRRSVMQHEQIYDMLKKIYHKGREF